MTQKNYARKKFDMETLFRKSVYVFLVCRGKRLTEIMSESGCSFAEVVNSINKFHEHGLIWKEKKGRINEIGYTKKGKEVYEHLVKVRELIKIKL